MQHKVLRLLFSSSNASFLDCMTAIEFKLRIELSKGMVDMILESVSRLPPACVCVASSLASPRRGLL